MAGPGEAGPGSGAGPVLQFFTRLRRHASLDGASPYFKVKKWKLEPNQRASSLDTRGELWPLAGSECQGPRSRQPEWEAWNLAGMGVSLLLRGSQCLPQGLSWFSSGPGLFKLLLRGPRQECFWLCSWTISLLW